MSATIPPPKFNGKTATSLQQAKRLQLRIVRTVDLLAQDIEQARSKDLRSRLSNSMGSMVRSWRELEDWKRGYSKRKSPSSTDDESASEEQPADPAATPASNGFDEPEKISKESLSAGTVPTPTPGEGPKESATS